MEPITEKEWLGLELIDAIKRAEKIGYTYRVVEENGVSFMLTQDFKSNRVNLRLSDRKVIGLYTG